MRKIIIDTSLDFLGHYEVRCTVDNEQGEHVIDVRGKIISGLTGLEWWELEEHCACENINVSIISPDYTRDDIFIGLSALINEVLHNGCDWATICLTDPRCKMLKAEIVEILRGSSINEGENGDIFIPLDADVKASVQKLLSRAWQAGEYEFSER